MSRGVIRLVGAWAALLLLLGATLGAAFLPLGPFKAATGYAIATAKAAIILWLFMELRRADAIARLATLAAYLWLAILFTLTAADFATRGWIGG